MRKQIEFDTFEERLMALIFDLKEGGAVNVCGELSAAIDAALGELTERERAVVLDRARDKKTLRDQALEYDVTEEEVRAVLARALRKLRHPTSSRRFVPFIRFPVEEGIDRIIRENPELMEKYSIRSAEDFKKALGDRYDSETREALMKELSPKDRAWVREYYLRNCNAGMDRFPACIKVTIVCERGVAWTPKEPDWIVENRMEFDRIKSSIKYVGRTQGGRTVELRSAVNKQFDDLFLNEMFEGEFQNKRFEDEFFSQAEFARWAEAPKGGSYAMDSDRVSIRCEFADGVVRSLEGNYPGYHPYDQLYKMSHDLLWVLISMLKV